MIGPQQGAADLADRLRRQQGLAAARRKAQADVGHAFKAWRGVIGPAGQRAEGFLFGPRLAQRVPPADLATVFRQNLERLFLIVFEGQACHGSSLVSFRDRCQPRTRRVAPVITCVYSRPLPACPAGE